MGVLDDAIRQHLELKRAHGADESELKRKEDEALGPVRREAEPAAEEPAPPTPEDAGAEEHVAAAEEHVAGEAVADGPASEPESEAPWSLAEDEPFAEEPPATIDSTAVEDEPPADQALAEPPPAGSETPTRGFDALSEDEPAGDGEDVLEETPEFLQETPEHDRLWFEQKPPRDFDFDDEEE